MKKTFAFIMMFCLVSMVASLATAASGPIQCQYFSGTTFAIDGDISEWPAGSMILDDVTVADQGIPTDSWPDPNPLYSIDVYMAWDEDYLYMAYDVTDPDAGLKTVDHPGYVGNRFVKDMLRIYFEMDNDDLDETGADSGEITWDIMASQTDNYNISYMVVNPGFGVDGDNYAASANGTLVVNTSSDGAANYVVEARLAWQDLSDRLDVTGMAYAKPGNGTVWGYDFLFIDDTPIQAHVDGTAGYEGGGQFVLHELHVSSTWSDLTFVGSPGVYVAPIPEMHEGQYAAAVTNTSGGGEIFLDRDFPGGHFDIDDGTEYEVSLWLRSGTDVPAGLTGSVQPAGAGGNMAPAVNIFTAMFADPIPVEWTYYSGIYTPEADVLDISLRFDPAPGATVVFDDIKVVDTATGDNIIPNGGFEAWGAGATHGTIVAEHGVPDTWRLADTGGTGGIIKRLGGTIRPVQVGQYAAKVTNTSEGDVFVPDTGLDTNEAKIDVTGITAVQVSWWMRSGTNSDATLAGVGIAPFDSGQVYLGGTYGEPSMLDGNNVVGPNWEYRSAEYVVPVSDTPDDPATVVSIINLGIRLMPGSSVVFDDFKIVDVANPDVNLVSNGDFEDWTGDAPESWRFFIWSDGVGTIERLEAEPDAPNAVRLDWTTMQ